MEGYEAQVNITYKGKNGDLPDPVVFDAAKGDILQWVTEALQNGVGGIPSDPNADLTGYVVEKFERDEAVDINRIVVRPKTEFGRD